MWWNLLRMQAKLSILGDCLCLIWFSLPVFYKKNLLGFCVFFPLKNLITNSNISSLTFISHSFHIEDLQFCVLSSIK